MAFDIEIQTNVERFQKKMKWTINNIYKDLNYTVLESPPFSLTPDSSPWIIQLDFQSADSFKIFLKNCGAENDDTIFVEAKGTVVFIDPTTSKALKEYVKTNFKHDAATLLYSKDIFFQQFLRLSLQLQGEALIIEFHMIITTYTKGDAFCEKKNPTEMIPSNKEVKTTIMEEIFKRNDFTDVVFRFIEKTIPAHEAVLSVTSPVFDRMFKHDTWENQTNTVTISDVDIHVFEAFLEFLYTRKIKENIKSNLNSMLALYEVSDKYDVSELQRSCANILLSSFVNVENVCKVLKLADLHSDDTMKDKLLIFLKKKFSEVVKTEEWSSLATENIKLASEVVGFITHQIK